jgi:hypothetical protein
MTLYKMPEPPSTKVTRVTEDRVSVEVNATAVELVNEGLPGAPDTGIPEEDITLVFSRATGELVDCSVAIPAEDTEMSSTTPCGLVVASVEICLQFVDIILEVGIPRVVGVCVRKLLL